MLGLITSDLVAAALVVGIPAGVVVLAVIWARARRRAAIWGAVSAAIVVVSAAGVMAAFRGRPVSVRASGLPPTTTSLPAAATPATCAPKGPALHVVAKGLSFDARCLAAPADSAISISFDNQDAGITHDFHILTADPTADPAAKTLFMGKLVTGPATVTYRVGTLPAGTYYFQCDVHPTLMNGTFVVG